MASRTISKDIHTIAEHRIKTADGLHNLYVQEWGNKKGTPIFFFHGGPGANCTDRHKIPYDPAKHYLIFFDQRGCGLSEPTGSTEHNETKYLIEDINLITSKLGIDKFAINGGSWGSTLALCYAIANPDKVMNMVLAGIFLGTKEETQWLEKAGYRNFFPEVYEFLASGVPEEYKENPGSYHRKKFIEDKSTEAAYRYTEAELGVLRLNNQYIPPDFTDEYDTTYGTMITHYMQNNCFIEEGHILKNAAALTMPIHIVHGRYDMVCQPINAYNLHKALPDSQIYWTMAGHSGSDRSNYDVLSTIYKLIY
jgi:proline iminopeptidase